MEQTPLDVAIALIEKDGTYLITQRVHDDSFGGYWEFPGGKLESEETLENCLIREIQEELGMTVLVKSKALVVEHPYPVRMIRLHCFFCTVADGEPQTLECAQWKWVLPHELSEFQFPPASSRVIHLLQKMSRP